MNRALIEALGQASSLELFHLSTILERLISDPSRILKIRARLHLGQSVRFLDWRHPGAEMHLTAGRVIAMKDSQVIVCEEGTRREWKLPYAAIEMPEAAEGIASDAESAPRHVPRRATRTDFRVGDRVSFDDRHLQARMGTIVRINQQTATVDCDGHRWRVSFALLHPVHEL